MISLARTTLTRCFNAPALANRTFLPRPPARFAQMSSGNPPAVAKTLTSQPTSHSSSKWFDTSYSPIGRDFGILREMADENASFFAGKPR
jgi:hypothetical protein